MIFILTKRYINLFQIERHEKMNVSIYHQSQIMADIRNI